MCGFAGAIALNGRSADSGLVRSMAACQWRRGPDDEGSYCDGAFAMAFRRLSILDLSPAGHQPFVDSERQLAMVFNGEIFNYLELRGELAAKGYRFRSGSDTEVLLAAYAEWGTECLPRLNGMWAFLIVDHRRGLLFGARDRFGIKPMYRMTHEGVFYFASEIKALRKVAPDVSRVNWPLAMRLIAEGRLDSFSPANETFFEGIAEVPSATGFTISLDGNERQWRYWSLPDASDAFEGDPVEEMRALLHDAVRLRLRSDVPVGVALSGGMDSSSIIAMMSRLVGSADGRAMHGLHAFSYMPKEFDEERFIEDTIALTGATHHRTDMTPSDLWDTLPAVLDAHDEPLHSPTALAGYQVYALASKAGVKVVLAGQGADECLGGYANYFSEAWLDLLRERQVSAAISGMRDFSAAHGESLLNLLGKMAIRLGATSIPRPAPRGARVGRYAQLLSHDALETSRQFVVSRPALGLRNTLAESLERFPLPLFLRIEDRNSMAHSVEARLPFLDYRLVSFAFRLSSDWKIRGRWNKFVLRESMKGVIPESVRARLDKMGFPTGFSNWIRGPLKRDIEERLSDSSLTGLGLFDNQELHRTFQEHLRGDQDHGLALFHAVQLAEWHSQTARTAELKSPVVAA